MGSIREFQFHRGSSPQIEMQSAREGASSASQGIVRVASMQEPVNVG